MMAVTTKKHAGSDLVQTHSTSGPDNNIGLKRNTKLRSIAHHHMGIHTFLKKRMNFLHSSADTNFPTSTQGKGWWWEQVNRHRIQRGGY